jgi:hypothetical protein
MSEPDPAIIQGDHPFKVEAVPSQSGGVNALAKHAPDLQKGSNLGTDHRETLTDGEALNDHRVQLDANLKTQVAGTGLLRQDTFDTQHREQFVDPSRRIRTHQRVKIQGSESAKADITPMARAPTLAAGNKVAIAAGRKLETATTAEGHEHREAFLRRIEQIKSSNESVGKDLEALEKTTVARRPLKPAD